MTKVEAVVTRERVETVIDAVETETGHVGVTVVEAIGHGRQRGVTHEYRGRVFESRFLPKALLTFIVEDDLARRGCRARSPTPPAPGTSRATESSGRLRSRTSGTTAPACRWARSRSHEDRRPPHRGQHRLGRPRGGPRHVHAGRVRVPRVGPDADEERRAHRRQERPHLRRLLDRLLGGRVRDRVRRRQLA